MKVILTQDIKGTGKKDQIIDTSDGYARNFLFPKNLAVEANAENMAKLKSKQQANAYKKDQEKEEAKRLAEKMGKIMLTLPDKVGENGKVFGGISSKEIAEALQKTHKITVDKKKIDMKDTIKELGTKIIRIKLYEGVIAELKVNVIGE